MATRDEGQPAEQHLHRRIFVSSSTVDLHAHRAAVVRVLREMGQEVIDMKDFGAQDGDATAVSLDELAEADVVVFVVAWRYGTLPEGETHSVTHLEYLAAKDRNLPRLVFLADPTTEADDALFRLDLRNTEHHQQLQDFRAELAKDRVAAFFTEPNDLANHVAAAVTRYLLGEQYRDLLRSLGLRPPRDLPPPVPGFVGRERELADLCQQLRQGQSTGVSAAVAGMAGVGKSALAAEAVHRLATEPGLFAGGITFVRCDGQTGLVGLSWVYDRLLAAWHTALTAEERAQATTPDAEVELRERVLRTNLRLNDQESEEARTAEATYRGHQALVLLDNVERELPLDRLLDTLATVGLTVLVTARHRPSAPRLQVRSLDVLDPVATARLFAERFQARQGEWEDARDEGPARTVAEALGYLPLAIELAAARAAQSRLRVADLAHDLQTAGRLGQLRDPLDPTRSVRYVFGQSLSQLAPQQQLDFAALSLPPGPDWPREVIEPFFAHLLASSGTGEDQVGSQGDILQQARDDLEALIAWSFVSLVGGDVAEDTGSEKTPGNDELSQTKNRFRAMRIRVHPLLREFAASTWAKQPGDILQCGHSALLAGMNNYVQAHAAPTPTEYSILGREEPLISGILDTVIVQEGTGLLSPVADRKLLITLVDNLSNYLNSSGHSKLGLGLYTCQLHAYRSLGNQAGEGTALNHMGALAADLEASEKALLYYKQALSIFRQVGDRKGEGTSLNGLGLLLADEGHPFKARRYYKQALSIFRQVGDRKGEGTSLNGLGEVAFSRWQLGKALRCFERALVIQREVGDRLGEGTALFSLGKLAYSLRLEEEGRHYIEQARAIFMSIGAANHELRAWSYQYVHSHTEVGRPSADAEGALDVTRQDLQRLHAAVLKEMSPRNRLRQMPLFYLLWLRYRLLEPQKFR